jgi:hypothetical protein
MDVADLRRLNMHAADQDNIGPGEIVGFRGRDILVDETDLPPLRQIGRKHQEPPGRHESAHVVKQREGANVPKAGV